MKRCDPNFPFLEALHHFSHQVEEMVSVLLIPIERAALIASSCHVVPAPGQVDP
jgi:hypothetical protein